jgi:hypothetical protein
LFGVNLGPGNTAQIYFDDTRVENLSWSSGHTSVRFNAPPGQGAVHNVRVVVGGQFSSSRNYSYLPPVISSVQPPEFSVAGGDLVVLSGNNLGTSGSVTFGSIPVQIISHNHNSIVCRAPVGTAPGSVAIQAHISGFVSNTQVGNYICPADFNQDGSVDFFDYLDFVAAFSTPC